MSEQNAFGLAALIITVIYTCVGLPLQIRRNYLTRSAAGLSLFMLIMLTLTFLSWLVYGYTMTPRNWYIVGSNLPGSVFILVILGQFWYYRKVNKGNVRSP